MPVVYDDEDQQTSAGSHSATDDELRRITGINENEEADIESRAEQGSEAEATEKNKLFRNDTETSTASDTEHSLFNPHGDKKSLLKGYRGKVGSLLKNKWFIGVGIAGSGIVTIILIIFFMMAALKVPHLAENITTYQFARVTRQMTQNTNRIVAEKAGIDSAEKSVFQRLKSKYTSGGGRLAEKWAKLDRFRPNKVLTNMQGSGELKFNYKTSALGRTKLTSVTMRDRTVPLRNTTGAKSLIPGFKFADNVNFAKDFAPTLNESMRTNNVGPIIRGQVAKNIRKKLGIGLIAWKIGEYKGKTAQQARLQIERDANKAISTANETSPKAKNLKEAVDDAKAAEEKTIADDKKLATTIENDGRMVDVEEAIKKGTTTSVTEKVVGAINSSYAIALAMCIVYEGSVTNAGPTIDAQTTAQQKAYYFVSSAADEQKDGLASDALPVGALNQKLGDISNTNAMRRASGSTFSTAGTLSPQATTNGSFSVLDALLGSSRFTKIINATADKACPVMTNIYVAGAVGIGSLIVAFFTGGTSHAAMEAAGHAAELGIKKIVTRVAKSLIQKETYGNLSVKVKAVVGDLVKSTAKIAAATTLARIIVMSESGYLNNGVEQGADFANLADSGGNVASGEINRQQFYARPLTKQEAAATAEQTVQYVRTQNATKSSYQRYFALRNPQSAVSRLAMSTQSFASSLSISSIPTFLGNLFSINTWGSIAGALTAPLVHAAPTANATAMFYGNIQWDFSLEEQQLLTTDSYSMLENQRILDASGKEDDIEGTYGECFSGDVSLGTLISDEYIQRDDDGNVIPDKGLCSPDNLGPHNPQYGDLVFRWRVARGYDNTLDQLDDMATNQPDGATTTVGTVKIATFNLQGASHAGDVAGRTQTATTLITSNDLDVVGLQEMQSKQRDELLKNLGSQYDIFPASSNNSGHRSENSIIWNVDRFTLVDKGISSGNTYRYFNGSTLSLPWVKLRAKDDPNAQEFIVQNTHDPADSDGRGGRVHQAEWRDVDAKAHLADAQNWSGQGLPVFMTGDFNHDYRIRGPGSATQDKYWTDAHGGRSALPYCILTKDGTLLDSYDAYKKNTGMCPTPNDSAVENRPDNSNIVDHIYVSKDIEVTGQEWDTSAKSAKATDHNVLIVTANYGGSTADAGSNDTGGASAGQPGSSYVGNDGFGGGSCVEYVKYILARHSSKYKSGSLGDGKDVASNLGKLGYDTNHTPAVHAVVSFPRTMADPTYGHVAIVAEVKADGSIVVEESNWSNPGRYGTHVVKASDVAKLTYAHTEKGWH